MKNQITKPSTNCKKTIFSLLEKTNKTFTVTWKNSQENIQDIQNDFQACAQNYISIRKEIEKDLNWQNSDLLQFYNLEAWFGQIQSQLNGLPQNPPNKETLLCNNKEIEELEKSLTLLYAKAEIFKIYVEDSKANDSKLLKKKAISDSLSYDYLTLVKRIEDYFYSSNEVISQRKAVYYYNFAESLIDKAALKNADCEKIEPFKHAIVYLDESASFYKTAAEKGTNNTKAYKDETETLDRKNVIEDQLEQLKKSQNHSLKTKKISVNSEKSSALTNSSIAPESLHLVVSGNQTGPSNNHTPTNVSILPPKKRKNWITLDAEEPASKKPTVSTGGINTAQHEKILIQTPKNDRSKKRKNEEILDAEEPAPKKLHQSSLPLNGIKTKKLTDEEMQQINEKFKEMLAQTPMDDPFRFYSQLFFNLSTKLDVLSKESSNHTLLTKLSWLDTAKKLIGLSSNKNADDETEKKINIYKEILSSNKQNLNTIRAHKRYSADPTDTKSKQENKNDLQDLFIREITDYYDGLEAFNINAMNLNSILLLIEEVKNNLLNPVASNKKLIYTGEIGNPLPHPHAKTKNAVSFIKNKSTSNVKRSWLSSKAKKSGGGTTPQISGEQIDALRRQVQARQEANSVKDKYVSDTKPSQPNTNIGSVMLTNSWNSTAQTIRKSSSHSSLTFENTLNSIEKTIQLTNKPETLFYAELLRQLIKFHVCDKNVAWHEMIFSPKNKLELNDRYLSILTISERFDKNLISQNKGLRTDIVKQQPQDHLSQQPPGQHTTLSNHTNSSSSFFRSSKPVKPLTILIETLQDHCQYLIKYKNDAIHSESICRVVFKFIQTYCQEEQASISHSRVSYLQK